jgi:hypothetical protein
LKFFLDFATVNILKKADKSVPFQPGFVGYSFVGSDK